MNRLVSKKEYCFRLFIQWFMGPVCYLCMTLPYVKRIQGLHSLNRHHRYLFVSNHVSLLDTLLLGGLFWRLRLVPILVLGDRSVWHDNWIKQAMSRPVGFLVRRGGYNAQLIQELQTFGEAGTHYNLLVFPEGTRGDGMGVGPCRQGIFYIAQEAQIPIVPIFLENMQMVSSKKGATHLLKGLQKVVVHVGQPLDSKEYLKYTKETFPEMIQKLIMHQMPPT